MEKTIVGSNINTIYELIGIIKKYKVIKNIDYIYSDISRVEFDNNYINQLNFNGRTDNFKDYILFSDKSMYMSYDCDQIKIITEFKIEKDDVFKFIKWALLPLNYSTHLERFLNYETSNSDSKYYNVYAISTFDVYSTSTYIEKEYKQANYVKFLNIPNDIKIILGFACFCKKLYMDVDSLKIPTNYFYKLPCVFDIHEFFNLFKKVINSTQITSFINIKEAIFLNNTITNLTNPLLYENLCDLKFLNYCRSQIYN